MCYNEAPADATLVLHHKFNALRHKHKGMFDDEEVWPAEEQMSQLVRIVSGVFEFVGVIIRFVDWTGDGGPRAHLKTFLVYMVDSPSASDQQPYRALDHFYIQALSNVPPDVLSVMKAAFALLCSCRYRPLNIIELVCLLSMGSDTFIPHLERLAMIGTDDLYYKSPCPCFRHFLEDPSRSGRFYTPKSESRLQAFQAYIRTLSRSSNLTAILKPQAVQWIQGNQNVYTKQTQRVRSFACHGLCDIRHAGAEWTSLRGFDFRCLAHTCDNIPHSDFTLFLKYLYAFDKANSPNIVRVEPVGPSDRQFIDKCEGLAEPLNLEEEEWPVLGPKYVLLGHETGTVLVVLASRETYGESVDEILSGVNIYTFAMLDYM